MELEFSKWIDYSEITMSLALLFAYANHNLLIFLVAMILNLLCI